MASTSDNKFAIRMILITLAAIILIVLITQYQKKSAQAPATKPAVVGKESFEQPQDLFNMPPVVQPIKATEHAPPSTKSTAGSADTSGDASVKPHEPFGLEDYKAVDFETESKLPSDCLPRDRLTKDDLLPKDAANSKWAQVNPAGQGDVQDQNFLTAGFHVGINTVGQSLRNPNYQLRSDPPNPRVQVSPWNQTTIEYDSSRRAFEIGQCD